MKLKFLTLSLVLACGLTAPAVQAAKMEGLHFDDGVRLGETELKLNGLGIRAIFIFKGYVAALYMTNKANTGKAVADMPGPKRLQLRMLRGASADVFKDAMFKGIQHNATDAEMAKLQDRINQMGRQIDAFGASHEGDVVNFDYLPDKGTSLTVNGVSKGEAVPGVDFYNAMLSIFVGENPVDTRLREGLLGK